MESVAVIGCGSLGGYLAQSLAELDEVKYLMLVDYDRVEEKNFRNSIFEKSSVGEYKTVALSKMLSYYDLTIETTEEEFKEGVTKIPTCDLVVDCRDFIYDRGNIIDARMYMSSRYLIVDCRKNTSYAFHYKGRYLHNLTKVDMRNAAFSVAMFIQKGLINDIIQRQMVHKIELDYLNRDMANAISLVKKKPDEIFEYHEGETQLLNLSENLQKIKQMNREENITIYVGSKDYPVAEKRVPAGQLRNSNDIVICLVKMLDLPYPFNNYVVAPRNEKGVYFIELLAETGAA